MLYFSGFGTTGFVAAECVSEAEANELAKGLDPDDVKSTVGFVTGMATGVQFTLDFSNVSSVEVGVQHIRSGSARRVKALEMAVGPGAGP